MSNSNAISNSLEEFQTLDGQEFLLQDASWNLWADSSLYKFRFTGLSVCESLVEKYKRCIANILSVYPVPTSFRYNTAVRDLLMFIGKLRPCAKEILLSDLISYRESFDAERLYISSNANIVLRFWDELAIGGITHEASAYAYKAKKYRRPKNVSVLTRCPQKGAYSELEFSGIQRELHASFSAGNISLRNYLISILSLTLGLRPLQIALLTNEDFIVRYRENGEAAYLLRVTRIKQKNTRGKSEFRNRLLATPIGKLISLYVSELLTKLKGQGNDRRATPLFPILKDDQRRNYSPPDVLQAPPASVGASIVRTLENLNVVSERTGSVISANASRARKTLGTRAAAEGKSALEIADLLDHTSAQTAKAYIEATPEILQRIDKAVAMRLAPLAQRFAGKIAARGLGHGVTNHIFGVVKRSDAAQNFGECGKQSYCKLSAPLACYTCLHFRPWVDGPHREMLNKLLLGNPPEK